MVVTADHDSVTSIALRANLPRTSAAKALVFLESIGLVHSRKVREKNRHVYFRATVEEIIKKTDEAKTALLGKKYKGSLGVPYGENSSVVVHNGKDAILAIIYKIISLHAGERVHILQGTNTADAWNKVIGLEEALKINDTFNKNGILWVGLRSDSFIKELKKKTLDASYKGRIGNIHVLPDMYFEESTAAYIFKGTILFVDLVNVVAIEINDKKIVSIFKKVILYLLEVTPRQHIG